MPQNAGIHGSGVAPRAGPPCSGAVEHHGEDGVSGTWGALLTPAAPRSPFLPLQHLLLLILHPEVQLPPLGSLLVLRNHIISQTKDIIKECECLGMETSLLPPPLIFSKNSPAQQPRARASSVLGVPAGQCPQMPPFGPGRVFPTGNQPCWPWGSPGVACARKG